MAQGVPAVAGESAGRNSPFCSCHRYAGSGGTPGQEPPRLGTELPPTLGTRGARDSRRVCPRSGRGTFGRDPTGPKRAPEAGAGSEPRGAGGSGVLSDVGEEAGANEKESGAGGMDRDGSPGAVGPPALPPEAPTAAPTVPREARNGRARSRRGSQSRYRCLRGGTRRFARSPTSPGLRGKGQSSAAFSEPARTRSSNIAASAGAPGAVRGARVAAEEWRSGAGGSAGSGAGDGRRPGRSGAGRGRHRAVGPGRSWAAVHRGAF